MKKYISSQHKYYTLDFYLKETFNQKVFKVPLNGNFTCPNRDGTISKKGCIFCSSTGSGEFAGNKYLSIKDQFNSVTEKMHLKWPNASYIPYFQANTNTYASLDKLKEIYNEAINTSSKVVALSIATRPDAISNETFDYLQKLNSKIPIWIELGLQTIHQKTANAINRGYRLNKFIDTTYKLRQRNINVIVHIINGLPGENKEMMIETIKFLNSQDIQGIKIHNLFILKNTPLGDMYIKKPFPLLSLKQYVDITVEQLAWLNDNIVVHRINGDPRKEDLITPEWCLKKLVIMNEIDKKMKENNYYQGIKS